MLTTAINKAGDRHYKTTVPLGFVEGFGHDGKRLTARFCRERLSRQR
jgi:hypothetical protein